MDGIVDWYLVGVAAGLGVAAGAALVLLLKGRAGWLLGGCALVLAVAGGAAIAVTAAVWAAVALAGAAFFALVALRPLTPEALPAAILAAAGLAVVPALGYVEAVAAPVLGRRLGRRAGSRYAGLRILAKD
jgi:hypothetical protein